MNGLLVSSTTWKFRCIQAYLHKELKRAEELNTTKDAKECVNDNKFVLSCLHEIVTIIENNNNTYEQMKRLAKSNPLIKGYYNSIEKVLSKYFTLEESWLPSLLAIETFRIFTEQGYNDFKHIDFMTLLAEYEKHENRKTEYEQEKYIIVYDTNCILDIALDKWKAIDIKNSNIVKIRCK